MPPPSMIDSHHTLHSIDADRVQMVCEHCRLGQPATHYAHTDDPARSDPRSLFLCDHCADRMRKALQQEATVHGR